VQWLRTRLENNPPPSKSKSIFSNVSYGTSFDKEEDGKSFKPIVETTVVGEDGYYRISVKKLD
jgi:ABC-type phosphate transport system ATPase subunit